MRLGPGKIVSELALRDVGDEAGVGSGSGQLLVRIEGGEVAVIPGTAQQRRKVSAAALSDVYERLQRSY